MEVCVRELLLAAGGVTSEHVLIDKIYVPVNEAIASYVCRG
jgi:hypothetical protein